MNECMATMKRIRNKFTGISVLITIAYFSTHIESPRCGHSVDKHDMILKNGDIELVCPKCDYPFMLTNKHIEADSKVSSEIDMEAWKEDNEHYKSVNYE